MAPSVTSPSTGTSLAAACMAVGLATAWAPSAQGDVLTEVRGTSTMPAPIDHVAIMLGGIGSGNPGGGGGVFAAGLTLPGDTVGIGAGLTYINEFSIATSEFGDQFAIMGIHLGSGQMHLVVSTPGLTILIGHSFEESFPGWSEQALIDSLLTGSPLAENFMRTEFAVLRQRQVATATCVSFSNGADFGTLTMTAFSVPSPGGAAVLGLVAVAGSRRRRR